MQQRFARMSGATSSATSAAEGSSVTRTPRRAKRFSLEG
jgi:hypothetical protein